MRSFGPYFSTKQSHLYPSHSLKTFLLTALIPLILSVSLELDYLSKKNKIKNGGVRGRGGKNTTKLLESCLANFVELI